jgi:hypothetical protein
MAKMALKMLFQVGPDAADIRSDPTQTVFGKLLSVAKCR